MFKILPEPMYYDWGDSQLVHSTFGVEVPAALTLAELWMGSHPRGPSRLAIPGQSAGLGTALASGQNLREVLDLYPDQALGGAAKRWKGELPFLLKILSAKKALSIQVHPSKAQAETGFARENSLGLPLTAPNRNYRDDNHKPECLMALGEFWALSGFREPEAIAELLLPAREALGLAYTALLSQGKSPTARIGDFMGRLLRLKPELLSDALEAMLQQASVRPNDGAGINGSVGTDPHAWFRILNEQFPGDPGCLAAYYLNILRLDAGDVLVMKSGLLHAYLAGIGVELMANSDNVLRAGCTSKHVDAAELAAITDFTPGQPDLRKRKPGQWFDSGFPEFRFLQGSGSDGDSLNSPAEGQPRILLCLSGRLELEYAASEVREGLELLAGWAKRVILERGQAVFIPASAGRIGIVHKEKDGQPCTWFCAAPGKE